MIEEMMQAGLEEWLQVLRNKDFISWHQYDKALKSMNELECEKIKDEILDCIRKNKTLEIYKKAEKLYFYIQNNYVRNNTNLSYKEILM